MQDVLDGQRHAREGRDGLARGEGGVEPPGAAQGAVGRDEERELFARQLDEILAWAESLQALDTSGVPPMSHPREGSALREDEPRAGLDRETAFEAAPDAAEGLFRVPRVIGG